VVNELWSLNYGQWIVVIYAFIVFSSSTCYEWFFIVYVQVYVKVNQEAKTDDSIYEAGKVYFNRMEQGVQHVHT